MKKAVVIGAYGHIGSYMVPALYDAGYEVTVISRGNREPYTAEHPAWQHVNKLVCDRKAMTEAKTFGPFIASLDPDVIIDTLCYNGEMLKELCEPIIANEALAKKVKLIEIGTIWIYAYKLFSPVTEDHPHNSVSAYGIGKTEMELYIRELADKKLLNATILHPGHISGAGWYPINPQGNLNPQVYADIVAGREIILPNDGSATLHHVHAEDIARLALACIEQPEASCGEAFHITSPAALTLRGFAELLYKHFGHEPKISFVPYDEFTKLIPAEDVGATFDHMSKSPCCSMEKARKLLGFTPKWSSIDTAISAVEYKLAKGELQV